MDLTQESIISLLVAEGGRVRKSDLQARFRSCVDCVDPAERDRNRELFKTFVNNVASVKEVDGVRCVVLKTAHQHLLGDNQKAESNSNNIISINCSNDEEISPEQEMSPVVQEEKTGNPMDPGGLGVCEKPPSVSPILLALQRSKVEVVKVRMLNFDVSGKEREGARVQVKPYGLPLRIPAPTRVEIHKLRPNPLDTCRTKRKPSSLGGQPPQPRRVAEEPKESRVNSMFPLEQTEHEWLVKCGAGHWTQVYGLLLGDCQLAEKRDFISGFTVLHWAAKCGNSKMLVKVMDLSREGKVDVDVNEKSHGGYTPLHIAALHDQEYIIGILVHEFGANVSIRDNCGKRACHYLHKGISKTIREMLTEPRPQPRSQETGPPPQREEPDPLPDNFRSLTSIGRLFQPSMITHKKKHGQRSGLYSLGDDQSEDQVFRHRAMSNASVC